MEVKVIKHESTTEFVCEKCGQVVEELFDVTDCFGDTLHWCEECRDNDAQECERCGEWHTNDDMCEVHDENGNTLNWCEDCRDHNAWECEHCGNYFTYEVDSQDVHITTYGAVGADWCPDCVDNDARQCFDCGEYYSEDCIDEHSVYSEGDVYVCESCIDDHYRTCQDCGILMHEDYAYWPEDNDWDGPYCPDCWPNHNGLSGYHHTTGDIFHISPDVRKSKWTLDADERKMLFLGVELETDYNDNANAVANDVKSCYSDSFVECKYDGSLNEEGVEIVGQPMTPICILTNGMWERIVDIVRDHGGTSYDAGTCGLHIHIGRDFFTDHDVVYRLDRMMHRFERQMIRFSRRNSGQMDWCRISHDDDDLASIKDVVERKKEWRKCKDWRDRYEAVNDCRPDTVEIRLWRGSLNMETIRATVEFTAGLAIVCNSMSDEFAEALTWGMLKLLVRFALEQAGIPHDDLDAYLERRGL